jgi:hypothetical protein
VALGPAGELIRSLKRKAISDDPKSTRSTGGGAATT